MNDLCMRLLPLLPATAVFAALSALPPAAAASLGKTGAGIYLLTDDNRLAMVTDTLAAQASPRKSLTGLLAGDLLMSIDVRPANQELYGLGVNGSTGTLQLYHLNAATGVAAAVGTPVTPRDSGNVPIPVAGVQFGIDFNPNVDRLRVVANNGLNFRMSPTTGAIVAMDTVINGGTTSIGEAAYTNNTPGSTATTLYTLDAASDSLYIQSNPNAGGQNSGTPVLISGIPVNFSSVGGFDIAPGVDVAASGNAATGTGYAALNLAGTTGVYRIDLANGNAILLGVPGFAIRGLAVKTQIPVAYSLRSNGTTLYRFRTDDPAVVASMAITGVNAAEVLAGVAFRPATGQLYGLGVNAGADTATLYLVDPATGACTGVGTTGQVAYSKAGEAVDFPAVSSGYGIDFNPTVDRIRVVTGSGANFRINPNTGGPVDGDATSVAFDPDGSLNGGSTIATAAAYTNSYAGATLTTIYALDPSSNSLWIVNPPNSGTMTLGVPVTLNGSPLDFTANAGLEIVASPGIHPPNADPAATYAYAALTVAGTPGLYWINLGTGAATLNGTIGSGAALSSLAVCSAAGAGCAPVSWSSVAGTQYSLETSTDLIHWQALPGTFTATSASTTVPVDTFTGEVRRFWRATGL
ncbi:MAG: Calx-beta domain protein [Akkermansiaceae bacterium]|nr:Calx-beta domain protein [Akkermansiaceae bacterium]